MTGSGPGSNLSSFCAGSSLSEVRPNVLTIRRKIPQTFNRTWHTASSHFSKEDIEEEDQLPVLSPM